MEDYPRDLTEFGARFGTEEACREYVFRLRWPDGFRCPRCSCRKSWAVREVLSQCAGCGHQTSVTAGTIFQDTRTPLCLWFQAMWWITTQKNGASALGRQRVLGLRQYQTAWTLSPRAQAEAPIGVPRCTSNSRPVTAFHCLWELPTDTFHLPSVRRGVGCVQREADRREHRRRDANRRLHESVRCRSLGKRRQRSLPCRFRYSEALPEQANRSLLSTRASF